MTYPVSGSGGGPIQPSDFSPSGHSSSFSLYQGLNSQQIGSLSQSLEEIHRGIPGAKAKLEKEIESLLKKKPPLFPDLQKKLAEFLSTVKEIDPSHPSLNAAFDKFNQIKDLR